MSSLAYINNKPFGEIKAGTVIYPKTTVNCSIPEDSVYIAFIQKPIIDIGNLLYNVEFDGNNYQLRGEDDRLFYSDNNVIFEIIWFNDMYALASTKGVHTFKITLAEDILQKLDPKYIPKVDGLPEVTTSDNGKILKVDNGVWTVSSGMTEQVQADWDETDDTSLAYIKNKPSIPSAYIHPETHPASMITGLATVATSGDYGDLVNTPVIPSIDGLATITYVDEQIASIETATEQVQADWDETDTTSPAYIKNKPSISSDGSSLPEVTTDDNGKTLVVEDGAWVVGEIEQMEVTGLPEVTTSDNNKVMTVVDGTWAAQTLVIPTELPSVTSSDDGKILKVSGGTWVTSTETQELPSVTTSDTGKFLRVSSSGIWAVEAIANAEEASF
jgi:hypothetical protein